MNDTNLTATPQVCMGGVLNPSGWDIVDAAGNWHGYVFQPGGALGDGRYWLEAPGMKRRGYATLNRAVAAVERFNAKVQDEMRVAA